MDWAAPTVVAAGVGAVSGAVTNLVGGWFRQRQDGRKDHEERLRSCCIDLAAAATRVGEGHEEAHEDVRNAYLKVYLATNSREVAVEARRLVRVSWNVKESIAGRPRLRPAPPGVPPSKEIRAQIIQLLDAVRREIGRDVPSLGEGLDESETV